MSTLTDQLRQLEEEITKHDQAATPGPWFSDQQKNAPYVWTVDCGELIAKTWNDDHEIAAANRDFIAFARTALLDLLAVANGLEEERQSLSRKLQVVDHALFEGRELNYTPDRLLAIHIRAKLTEQVVQERDALRAENKRMRKALEWIKTLEVSATDSDRLLNILAMKTKADETLFSLPK